MNKILVIYVLMFFGCISTTTYYYKKTVENKYHFIGGPDGGAYVFISNIINNRYYIEIRHQNGKTFWASNIIETELNLSYTNLNFFDGQTLGILGNKSIKINRH